MKIRELLHMLKELDDDDIDYEAEIEVEDDNSCYGINNICYHPEKLKFVLDSRPLQVEKEVLINSGWVILYNANN